MNRLLPAIYELLTISGEASLEDYLTAYLFMAELKNYLTASPESTSAEVQEAQQLLLELERAFPPLP